MTVTTSKKQLWFEALIGVIFLGLLTSIDVFAASTITIRDSVNVFGDTSVSGSISKGSGTFVIDHPLD
ncbi:MAG: hypothetical protein AAFO91_18520, partial [Bacteroidota bacterium]